MEDFFACSNDTNLIPPPPNGEDDAAYIRNAWQHFDERFGGQAALFNAFDFHSTGETTPGLTVDSAASTPSAWEHTDEAYSSDEENAQPDAALANDAPDQTTNDNESDSDNAEPEQAIPEDPCPDVDATESDAYSGPIIEQSSPTENVAASATTAKRGRKPSNAASIDEDAGPAPLIAQSSSLATAAAPSTNARGRKRQADNEQGESLHGGSKRQRFTVGTGSGSQVVAFSDAAPVKVVGRSTSLVRTSPLVVLSNAYGDGSAVASFHAATAALNMGLHAHPAPGSFPQAMGYVASRQQMSPFNAAAQQPLAGPSTGGQPEHLRGQENSAAQCDGQHAQSHSNTTTRLNRAFKALFKERSAQLAEVAQSIIDLDDGPASELPAPQTFSDDDKAWVGAHAQKCPARTIPANEAGYVTCEKCQRDYGLSDELVINKQSALLRHATEYHSNAACSACGLPVAGRDTKAYRRHRAVCPIFHALVKTGRYWDWLLEYGLVRADVNSMGNEFFNRDERLAAIAKRPAERIESLRRVLKYGEVKKLRKSLKLAPEVETDVEDVDVEEAEDEEDEEPVAGPSRLPEH